MKKAVALVAHDLPADVRQHAMALSQAGLLDTVFTGYVHVPTGTPERMLQAWPFSLSKRAIAWSMKRPPLSGVADQKVLRMPLREITQSTAGRLMKPFGGWLPANDYAKRAVSRCAAKRLSTAHALVVAREMEAYEAFQAALHLGIERLYQLPIAHYATMREILDRENAEFPGVSTSLPTRQTHAPGRLARKDAELSAATTILAPSEFVKDSLTGVGIDGSRISVIPFGCEPEWALADVARNDNLFLHVGQLSVRKGTHRLLRAWKSLNAHRTCELRLIGSMRLSRKFLADFRGIYNHVGPVARHDLRRHYANASCFVLPALAEGFAVVVLEAISCGTPLAVSRNSGAQGFITEGREGTLFDAQDDDQLCAALEWMLTHSKERAEMSRCCMEKARNWTWDDYRRKFLELVHRMIRSTEHESIAEWPLEEAMMRS